MKDGLYILEMLRQLKISSDWYFWMHHTIDRIPDQSIERNILGKRTF